MNLKPCKFYFADETTWDGFTDGTTWNGFDNVWVTPEVHQQISDYFLNVCKYHPDEISLPTEPDGDGLYSYANGFTTSIDEDHWYIINR